MKTYTLYVHDRRYRVPTLLAADFANDDRAAAFARERVNSSLHYTAIEVWHEDRKLLHIEADNGSPAAT